MGRSKGAMQAPLVIDEDGNATERLERDANGAIWHCVDGSPSTVVTPEEARSLVYASDLNVNAKPEGLDAEAEADAEDDAADDTGEVSGLSRKRRRKRSDG